MGAIQFDLKALLIDFNSFSPYVVEINKFDYSLFYNYLSLDPYR